MTNANLVNIIVNITAKVLGINRADIEKPYTSSENVSEARTVIAKVSVSYGLPISVIRRALNRDENLTLYYLAHDAKQETIYEVKKQVDFYLEQVKD
ncbi:MAG: hypothetical protein MJZ23_08365 [Paludibacteraceae bacterium]|nr:hypothetical protein [Paludibacteraceae bacterium]